MAYRAHHHLGIRWLYQRREMLLLLAPLNMAAGVVSFGFGIVTEVVGHNGRT